MAYIGNRPVSGDNNSFRVLDDIKTHTFTFDGSSSSVVSTSDDTITHLGHRLIQGQRVTYTDGTGSPIGGLTDGTVYFVVINDANSFKLASSASNASAGTGINLTSVGSGTAHNITVAFDGVNTKFKATFNNGTEADVTRVAQIQISLNNVIQQPQNTATPTSGFGFDTDSVIVFATAPASNATFWGVLFANNFPTFEISDNDVDNFTGNGSTTEFSLSKSPATNENIIVTIDGVVQYPSDNSTTRAYNTVGNALQFSVAPHSDSDIQVRHIGFAGPDPSVAGVTAFYGRTGSVFLNSSDSIVVNDAEVTGNLTVQGSMTTLDTKVTEVDQLEVAANNTTVGVAITQSGSGDILNLYDGSTEVFTVEDGGNVGIGTNNPGSLLHLHGTGGSTSGLTFKNSAGKNVTFYMTNDTSSAQFAINFGGTGGSDIQLHNGGNVLLAPNLTGNIGIGTYTAESRLHVNGDAKITGIVTAASFVGGLPITNGADNRVITATSASAIQGEAGLTFDGSTLNNAGSGFKEISVSSSTNNSSTLRLLNNQKNFSVSNVTGGKFAIADGSNQRFIIDGSGNVGVGTNSISTRFEIEGTAALTNHNQTLLIRDSVADDATGRGGNIGFGAYVQGTMRTLAAIGALKKNSGTGFDGHLAFYTRRNGVGPVDERMRIHSEGIVEIIGQDDQNNFEINVNSSQFAVHTDDSDGEISLRAQDGAGGTNSKFMTFFTQATGQSAIERFRITESGEIRIANGGKITVNTDVSGNYAVQEALRIDDANGTNDRAFQIFEYHDNGSRWHSLNQNLNVTTTGSSYTYTQGNYGGSNMIQIKSGDLRIYNDPSIVSGGTSAITPTERVSILADGRIGINDPTPGNYELDIRKRSTADDTQVRIYNDGTGNTQHTIMRYHIAGTSASNYIYFGDGDDSNAGQIRYQHGNDSLQFYVNAGEKLRITDDGKIGIGTVSPEATLDVYGDNTSAGGLIQITQDGTGDAAIDFQLKGTREYSLGIDNSDSDKFKLSGSAGLANNTLLTVTNSGDVGIGTEVPTTKLDVCLGSAWIYPNANGTDAVALKLGKLNGASSSLLDIRVADNDNSTTPTYQVTQHIRRYIANWHFERSDPTGIVNAFKFRSSISTTSLGNSFIIRDRNDTIDSVKLWSEGNSFIGVGTAGTTINLGIGTDSPDGKTHIYRNSAGSVTAATDANDLVIESSTNVGMSLLTANDSLARIKFGDPDANNAGAFIYNHQNDKFSIITATGNRMIIGADMISARTHYGVARTAGGYTFRETNEGGERAGMHSDASNHLIFKTGAADEKVRITHQGNVGIGSSPDERLHVVVTSATATVAKFERSHNNNVAIEYRNTTSRMFAGLAGDALGWAIDDDANLGNSPMFIVRRDTSRVGIGSLIPADRFDVHGNAIFGAQSTADAQVQIGRRYSGNRNAYVDLIGDDTYHDYGLRVIRKSDGENAESQIAHRGTGNLSIDAQEAATIRFAITGSERLHIDSSGHIKIPDNAEIRLGGAQTTTGVIKIYSESGTSDMTHIDATSGNGKHIRFIDSVAGTTQTELYHGNAQKLSTQSYGILIQGTVTGTSAVSTNSDGEIKIGTRSRISAASGTCFILENSNSGGDEVLRVTSDGKVGIGTNDPEEALHIQSGSPVIKFSDGALNSFIKGDASNLKFISGGTSKDFMFQSSILSTSEVVRITGDGKVGIGTNSPADILDINSDSASAVTNMYLRNHANAGGAALNLWTQGTYASPTYKAIIGCSDAGGNIRMGAASNHDLLLLTNNDAKITIKSDGKVGVGTADPLVRFHVDNPTALGGTEGNRQEIARFDGNVANNGILEFSNMRLSNGSDWESSAFRIQRIIDVTRMGYIDFGTGAGSGTGGDGRNIQFGAGDGTLMMHLDSEGKVGIGTAAPARELDVIGDVGIEGALFLGEQTTGAIGKITAPSGNVDIYADGTIDFIESDNNKTMVTFDINTTHDDARIYMEGDNDTFWNHPASNELGFTVGGQNTLRLQPGQVGIRTDSPDCPLHVETAADQSTIAIFGSTDSTSADTYQALLIRNNIDGYPGLCNASSTDVLDVRSAGSVQVTIDDNNNDTNKFFRVITNGTGAGGTELFKVQEDGVTSISGFNGTGLKMRGSGSDYQGMQLQVTDASASQTRNIFIDVVNENGSAVANQVGQIQSDGGSKWSWSTQPAGTSRTSVNSRVDRLHITANGSIGINQHSPSATLDVRLASGTGLGETAGDEVNIAEFGSGANATGGANDVKLLIQNVRLSDGNNWTTTSTRIQRRVDVTDQSYIDFGTGGGADGGDIELGYGSRVNVHIENSGGVGIASDSSNTGCGVVKFESGSTLPDNAVGGITVKVGDEQISNEIKLPRNGHIMVMTGFSDSGGTSYPQPQASGMLYVDVGLSTNIRPMYTQSGIGSDATSNVGTDLVGRNTHTNTVSDCADGRITIMPGTSTGTIRICNREANSAYVFYLTFL